MCLAEGDSRLREHFRTHPPFLGSLNQPVLLVLLQVPVLLAIYVQEEMKDLLSHLISFFFFWPHTWHVEVPRPKNEPLPQQ